MGDRPASTARRKDLTTSAAPVAPGSATATDAQMVARLMAVIARRDLEIDGLRRDHRDLTARVDDLAVQIAALRTRPTPKIIRVVRKRLRALGLLPNPTTGETPKGQGLTTLQDALAAAPEALKPFLEPLDRYEAWQAANAFTAVARADLQQALEASGADLRISVITPVFNTPAYQLEEMVESVLGQVYQNWELCIVDDASSSAETREILDGLAARDPRIRVAHQGVNGGISAATNAAVAMATGEVIAFLDHDDLLTPDCLAEVALYYTAHPTADLVYSDDDKIDERGRRYAPQFKPDWAPTLLLSYMYMGHVLTVRRSLFQRLGGFRSGFDGSQDYDFALRATEQARHIGHIPRVLYNWRATAGSTALSGDAKPESFEAGRKAVEEAMQRRKIDAGVLHPAWALQTRVGMYALEFPDTGPSVTIIIPTYNKVDLLSDCVASLSKTTYDNYSVLVVDNGSDDPDTIAYLERLRQTPGFSVLGVPRGPNGFSFAAVMNEAVRHADGDFVLFLNNDTKVINERWLSQMVGYGRMEGVGSVGARLLFGDNTVQHAGIVHGYNEGLVGHAFRGAPAHDWGYMGFMRTAREYSAVTAACVLTPRALFESLGGFDEARFAVAYNDVDYGFRLVANGYGCVYCPEAELYHLEGKSRGQRDNPREVIALRETYRDWREGFYNPNLSLDNEQFEPAARRLPLRASRPIRVAAVTHNLRLEGAPNTLLDLLVGLKRAGVIDPVVLSPSDGPLAEAYAREGIEVRLFRQPAPQSSLSDFLTLRHALGETFAAVGAEVVVANTLTAYYAVSAAADLGLASIWCQHESEPWETYFNDLTPGVRSHAYAAFGQAYAVTYVAEATRRRWQPVQTRHNAVTIRHGIPPERLEAEVSRWTRVEARRHLQVRGDELVLILIGTVCRRKGQMDLVKALAGMSESEAANLRVFIVGAHVEADYATDVARTIADLAPAVSANVDLVGSVEDMTVYYAAADIFVCTSRIESAPRVIVEAMAFSLPIITTPVFGIPELVGRDVNALFYPPDDVMALKDLILGLAVDAGRRRRLGDASLDVLHSRPGYREMLVGYSALIREAALLNAANTLPELTS